MKVVRSELVNDARTAVNEVGWDVPADTHHSQSLIGILLGGTVIPKKGRVIYEHPRDPFSPARGFRAGFQSLWV